MNVLATEPLGKLLKRPATYGIVKAGAFRRNGIPMVRGGDIRPGRILGDLPRVSDAKSQEYARTVLQPGDVLIALVGYPGNTAVVPENLRGANISRAVGLLRPGPELDPNYLAHFLNSPFGRREFLKPSAGSAQIVVNLSDLNKLQIPLPALPEQHAIASSLSDVENEVDAVERLIAKKEAIKQGMMQLLLTGRARLPGFDAPWTTKPFGELLAYEQPGRYLVSSVEYVAAGTPVLTAGKTFVLGYTSERRGTYASVPVIIFDDFTTASKLVEFPFKAKSSAMKMLSARPGVNLRYIFERMQLVDFVAVDHKRRWIAEYSKIEIAVPELAEQDAVAVIMETCDSEIRLLQERLAKARDIKTGLMQRLLTGRVRIGSEPAS